ncbi:helix-turn-helix domain-containing protein [Anaeromicrobium sediminis]|uniref:HTH araC/xylS-type domain-containing protein n=1 Tax=Anaeromicrobium sediminis TaxID=1478221 RepID=A0A267MIR8_9FIRM|nr:helix-turn-helix domain-containing protein [Anaeromicrobium sediminis]PAB59481.1 hypothetical protein CCE28_09705 [Anaeromicrobium sediminis]
MALVNLEKYPVKNHVLKSLIKYFWVMDSHGLINISHKLLPVNNIDMILNLSSSIKYIDLNGKEIICNNSHFSGLRKKHYTIVQRGKGEVIGISFFPQGIYPFLKVPINEFKNKIIDIDLVIKEFTNRLKEKLYNKKTLSDRLSVLEEELINILDFNLLLGKEKNSILNEFNRSMDKLNIKEFCNLYGVNERRLERLFNKHVGVSPKEYHKISRFQYILKMLLEQDYEDLTSLAYEGRYYDQTHFVKEFKSYTGTSPSNFIKEKKSVKEILEYS